MKNRNYFLHPPTPPGARYVFTAAWRTVTRDLSSTALYTLFVFLSILVWGCVMGVFGFVVGMATLPLYGDTPTIPPVFTATLMMINLVGVFFIWLIQADLTTRLVRENRSALPKGAPVVAPRLVLSRAPALLLTLLPVAALVTLWLLISTAFALPVWVAVPFILALAFVSFLSALPLWAVVVSDLSPIGAWKWAVRVLTRNTAEPDAPNTVGEIWRCLGVLAAASVVLGAVYGGLQIAALAAMLGGFSDEALTAVAVEGFSSGAVLAGLAVAGVALLVAVVGGFFISAMGLVITSTRVDRDESLTLRAGCIQPSTSHTRAANAFDM